MTSLTGSPMRSQNSFINRYMTNLENTETTLLKPVSPSKINSASNRAKESLKVHFPSKASEKENNTHVSPKKILVGSYASKKIKLGTSGLESPSIESHSNLDFSSELKTEIASKVVDVSTLSRKDAKYYEFLCRITEAKKWIESIIDEQLPSELELVAGNVMRNGVFLAQVTQKINPGLVKKIVPPGNSLQYTHTQNINAFFALVENVGVPENFRFELTDLYDKKDIPKVFETIHALANIINKKWPGRMSEIQNLSGIIPFSNENVKTCQRKLPAIHDFRSFKNDYSPIPSPSKSNKKGLINDFNIDEIKPTKALLCEDIADDSISANLNQQSFFNTPTKENIPAPSSSDNIRLSSPIFDEIAEQVDPLDFSIRHRGLTDTPQLQFNSSYSPEKSFSYYSPTIARHLSYRTENLDFHSRRRFEQDDDHYDTFEYGVPTYSPIRRKRMAEAEFLDTITAIQATCRGVNYRFDLLLRERKLAIISDTLLVLQGKIRGTLVRLPISSKFHSLEFQQLEPQINYLQAFARGVVQRSHVLKIRIRLLKVEQSLLKLQSLCHGIAVKRKYERMFHGVNSTDSSLKEFQASSRGMLSRRCIRKKHDSVVIYQDHVRLFQGFVRGYNLRNEHQTLFFTLNEGHPNLIQFQAVLKGISSRKHHEELVKGLAVYRKHVTDFLAHLRGSYNRSSIKSLVTAVRDSKDPVVSFQALTKGVLARYALELLADYVESNDILGFQCRAKGYLKRRDIGCMRNYYKRNLQSITKIQSRIRSRDIRWAYLEFMSSGNPSLWSVRKFVHLLNEIHCSHESQNRLEDLKSLIDQANKDGDKIQSHTEVLKFKANILRENHILVSSNLNSLSDNFETEGDFSGSFPIYEKLFYLLQTDTFYWKSLFRVDPNFSMKYVTKSYISTNGSMTKRENAFFIKLVADLLSVEIDEKPDVKHFLLCEERSFSSELTHYYILHQVPELMIDLFRPILDYLERPDVDFEAVPANIYHVLYPERPEIPSSEAIEDNDTKSHFVANLTSLWTVLEMISESLTRNYTRIPEEIKFLCTKAYKSVADRSPHEKDALLAISKIFIEEFICFFFENPTKFGLEKLNYSCSHKVSIMIDALITVYSFNEFQGYMTPLNQYVSQIEDDIAISLKSMLTSPAFENHCEKLIYYDMSQGLRPILNIPKQYLLDIVDKLQKCTDSFPHDDEIQILLKEILKEGHFKNIQSLKRDVVTLKLNPSAFQLSSADDRVTSIYNEVKRGLSYMMQIEEVDTNLYDLLTSSVIPSDEPIFHEFLDSSASIKSDPLIKSLNATTYFSLKQHVLERSYELKQMGALNIEDHCQSLLNDIANTIKSRSYVVRSITNEVQIAETTLKKIEAKNKRLQADCSSLQKTVSQSIKSVQRTNNYLPVRKNGLGNKLKDAYKKVHNKSHNESNCLSLEWSARRLYELEVLVDISGENLGKVAVKFFGSSGPKFPEVCFKISTSDGEMFGIEMVDDRKNDRRVGGNIDSISFGKLLELLAKNKSAQINLFSMRAKFNAYQLLQLIIQTFYRC